MRCDIRKASQLKTQEYKTAKVIDKDNNDEKNLRVI